VEHYEALRQNAAAAAPGRILPAAPLGAILVVKTGVAGWLQRWHEATAARPAPAPTLAYPNSCDTPGWQHELTLLLAQMSVRHVSGS
jgi:hypothetical protein